MYLKIVIYSNYNHLNFNENNNIKTKVKLKILQPISYIA